jgi:hypothetical protein
MESLDRITGFAELTGLNHVNPANPAILSNTFPVSAFPVIMPTLLSRPRQLQVSCSTGNSIVHKSWCKES